MSIIKQTEITSTVVNPNLNMC